MAAQSVEGGPIDPLVSLRDRAYRSIQSLIVSGELHPGERLTEQAMGERLGMSRNPVREALKLLEQEGFVVIQPHRGALVGRLDRAEALDVFEMRSLLDGFAARKAAALATDEHLTRLKKILETGDDAIADGRIHVLAQLNSDFHEEIYGVAGNIEVQRAVINLRLKVQWMFAGYAASRGAAAWHEHRTLYESLANGDGDKAAEWSSFHVSQSRDAYLALIGSQ
jgi:DNA-binding GntR family transcriptional regulator